MSPARCRYVEHRLKASGFLLTVAILLGGCDSSGLGPETQRDKRMIILGFDGMDYSLATRLMAEGRMPHLKRLAETGHFQQLATAVPPQSPVAWTNFITGLDSGGHGIFDFMHRDPGTLLPYLSTSRAVDAEWKIRLGRYQVPLSNGSIEALRRGKTFWEVLEEHGVETTIIRMPTNFPPSGSASRELSGMGTPDILGTYGTFSLYTSDVSRYRRRELSGGKIFRLNVENSLGEGKLIGPDNPFLAEKRHLVSVFRLHVEPEQRVALLEVADQRRVIRVGEWTDWVPFDFEMVPTQRLRVQARFYLKSVSPVVELYVSPLNLDPFSPAMPISTPPGYARELAEAFGRFYTQGMPEDTNALEAGVLDREEFLAQAEIAGREVIRQYEGLLETFDRGLLFYYFGNLDQVSHMLFRPLDPGHPAYDAELDAPFVDAIPALYIELDRVVGMTLERMHPGTTLVVMSDHGFASIRREFNLNAWLRENGYLVPLDPYMDKDPGLLLSVDWSRTRAYGLGLNGLYINLRGRERSGIVDPSERETLMAEISQKLLRTLDPKTGLQAVSKMYAREKVYQDLGQLHKGPDLLVGYGRHTQCSGDSALGKVIGNVFSDNRDEWSGNHAMDHELVPGVLFSNHPLQRPVENIQQLAGVLMAEFGVVGFPRMETETLQPMIAN